MDDIVSRTMARTKKDREILEQRWSLPTNKNRRKIGNYDSQPLVKDNLSQTIRKATDITGQVVGVQPEEKQPSIEEVISAA